MTIAVRSTPGRFLFTCAMLCAVCAIAFSFVHGLDAAVATPILMIAGCVAMFVACVIRDRRIDLGNLTVRQDRSIRIGGVILFVASLVVALWIVQP